MKKQKGRKSHLLIISALLFICEGAEQILLLSHFLRRLFSNLIVLCQNIIYSALRLLLIEMVLFHLFINFIYRFSPVQHIVFIGRIVVVITMVKKTVPAINEDFFYNFLFLIFLEYLIKTR